MQKRKYEEARQHWAKKKKEDEEEEYYKPQQSNKKRSEICKFYGKGRCNKGAECRFRHIEEDFGDKTWGKDKSWKHFEEQEDYKDKWQKHKGGADFNYKNKNDSYKSEAVGSGGRYGASAASSKQSY